MKRNLLIILSVLLFSCFLVGCGSSTVTANVSDGESVSSNTLCKFIYIGGDLVYDSATRIVYIDNYTYGSNSVYTPYYAPNGLPYKYNSETNTFEEIEISEVK